MADNHKAALTAAVLAHSQAWQAWSDQVDAAVKDAAAGLENARMVAAASWTPAPPRPLEDDGPATPDSSQPRP